MFDRVNFEDLEGQMETLSPRASGKLIAGTSRDVKVVDTGVDKIVKHVRHHCGHVVFISPNSKENRNDLDDFRS